jgi:hypothetical protein
MSSQYRRMVGAAVAALALGACFPPTDGREPPLGRLYFPVGVALSGGIEAGGRAMGADAGAASSSSARWLFVANSDFDLQFNAGSLQAFDLDRLRSFLPRYCEADADCEGNEVCDGPGAATNDGDPSFWCVDPANPKPCGDLGEKSPAERLLSPGRCSFIDPVAPAGGEPVLRDSVTIGAFVTDVLFREPPANETEAGTPLGRLFLPVRGDATLHWVDVRPTNGGAVLDCGQGETDECDGEHRRGTSPAAENSRNVALPPEPFGVAADKQGRALVVTHQTEGKVALFVNEWGSGAAGGPHLEFVLAGLPAGAVAAASIPEPAIAEEGDLRESGAFPHEPGFLVTFRTSPRVQLVRFFDDAAAEPERPFLEGSRFVDITTNAEGFNSRGVAVDDELRGACEIDCRGGHEDCIAQCAPGDTDCSGSCAEHRDECFQRCAGIPLDVYVANRSPASLVIGETRPNFSETSSDDLPRFIDNEAVSLGASRVVVGKVIGKDGVTRHSRVFVICFDSRKIFVYDPRARRMETVIQTGRGPHALAVDPGSGLGFIAHFTDSYVGVVDLNQTHAQDYGRIIATLGPPTPPRASK